MAKSRETVPAAKCPNCGTPISIAQATIASKNITCRSCDYALVRRDGFAKVLAVPAALVWIAAMRHYGIFSLESGSVLLVLVGILAVFGVFFAKVELRQP